MTKNNLSNMVDKFVKERNWDDAHNPKNLSMAISIEASELMEIFQWMNIEDSKHIMNTDENEHVREEVADIMIYCLSLCNHLNIDINEAIIEKLKKNAVKYPVNREI